MSHVTLENVKTALKVDYDADDALLQILLDGAENWLCAVCGIGVSEATYTERVDGGGTYLWPSRGPVISVTSVTDMEAEEVEDADDYALINRSRIMYGAERWPIGDARYQVVYVAGYGATVSVPAAFTTAVVGMVSRAYDNPGGQSGDSTASWNVAWQSLLTSDIAAYIAMLKRRTV